MSRKWLVDGKSSLMNNEWTIERLSEFSMIVRKSYVIETMYVGTLKLQRVGSYSLGNKGFFH